MALTDVLWKDGYLETRLLAATLLGRIHPGTPLLVERVGAWVSRVRDKQLRTALLGASLARIRKETPDRFLWLIAGWFDPAVPKMWANAIYALVPLLEDPTYDNLPPVYNILTPVIQNIPPTLQNELADLINALYAASPVETTYFLRQAISGSTSAQTPTVLRRILTALPEKLQPVVLELVRQKASH
jgi:hypothetical protein